MSPTPSRADLGRIVMVMPTYNESLNLEWIVGRLRSAEPDVTFAQDRATADAIAAGELSASSALTSGRLTVRGATARLADHREVLARLDEAFAHA